MIPFGITLALSTIAYLLFIPLLRTLKYGQSIRMDGPKSHLKKKGTPTMGGIIFILISIAVFCSLNYANYQEGIYYLLPFSLFGFGLVGFLDDFLIIKFHKNDGLTPKSKLLLEAIIALLFIFFYRYSGYKASGWILIFMVFLFLASSNVVNLTDGIDGLAGGIAILILSGFSIIAYWQKQAIILSFCLVLIGSLLAFLIFNFNPAKIFMGDTGSLALGGLMAALALFLDLLWIYPLMMFPYVIETLSVILQVFYFKRTKKRLFKMAPLHHDLEARGKSEKKIVLFFYLITMASLMGSLLIYWFIFM